MLNNILFFLLLLSGCGQVNNSTLSEIEPTEDEYIAFSKEIDFIIDNHKKFAIKIENAPIGNDTKLTPEFAAFESEILRIYGLSFFSNHEKYRKFWPRYWQDRGIDQRNRYIIEQIDVSQGLFPGDIKTPLSFLPSPLTDVRAFFDEAEIKEFANSLPQYHRDIKWDGSRERYLYEKSSDRIRINAIAGAIFDPHYREEFKNHLKNNPTVLKTLRSNSKTTDPRTQYEPIDLLQVELGNHLIHTMAIYDMAHVYSPINLIKLAHRSLFLYFDSTKEDDYRGWELESFQVVKDIDRNDKFHVYCADGGQSEFFTDQDKVDLRERNAFLKSANFDIFSLIDRHQDEIEFECRGKIHTLEIKRNIKNKIPLPEKYNLSAYRGIDPFRVVIPFALTEEVDKRARWIFHRYMNYYGFKYHGERHDAPTKPLFAYKMATADMVIPVTHSLNLNSFHLGTKSSIVTRYTRKFTDHNGQRVPVEVEVFFPNKTTHQTTVRAEIDTDDLALILHQRRQVKNTPLMVFVNSCFAQNSLFTWMKAYRKSAVRSQETGVITSFNELRDVPHIIAPRNGFPTASSIDVLSNIIFPFVAIETIASGKQPIDLYRQLNDPDITKRDYIARFLRKIQSWKTGDKSEDTIYNPAYNLHYQELFDAESYEFLVKIEGQDEVIEF